MKTKEPMTEQQKNILRGQMHELMDIILDGNGFERRSRDSTGTLPTLFFRFSGHTNEIDIDLHTDGWEPGRSVDMRWNPYINEPLSRKLLDEIRQAVEAAYKDKRETDVLRRDIARQEGKVKDEKDRLAELKRTLKRKERKEKRNAELDDLFDPGEAPRAE